MSERLRSERGFTLVETMMTGLVALIILGGLTGWIHAVANTNRETEYQRLELDSVRDAKSQLMREVRFASAIYPLEAQDDREIVFWLDEDDSGGTAPGDGELITWRIDDAGRLVRTVDDTLTATRAEGIVPGASSITYDASAGTVTIHLVVDRDPEDPDPSQHQFTGSVTVRNVVVPGA
ncbi:MAG: hypothetical protein R3290_03915 [Acidimicrobiia bacterium]|nr:hypothetical protein [Acidimicrobiia bacterium]